MTRSTARDAGAAFLSVVGSSMFALVLVGALALLSLVGAVVPQEGDFDVARLILWKQEHPGWTAVLEPAGGFGTFRSWPFLVVTALLALNTLVCTALRYVREGGIAGIRRNGVARRSGFYLLHLSIVILIVAGFVSFATSFSAQLILTEGQTLPESRESYISVSEGPLRTASHRHYGLTLESVTESFADATHRTDVTARLAVRLGDEDLAVGDVRYNEPLAVRDLSFVLSETGYAPRIAARRGEGARPLLESFVALQTVSAGGVRTYRDFLVAPFLTERVVVEVLPDCEWRDSGYARVGEVLRNPALRIERQPADGTAATTAVVRQGEWAPVGDFEIGFVDLRRWSMFRVTEDRAYPAVWLALWLAVGAMALRYWPDLATWFREGPAAIQGGDDGRIV